jgi:hypothetical protein
MNARAKPSQFKGDSPANAASATGHNGAPPLEKRGTIVVDHVRA